MKLLRLHVDDNGWTWYGDPTHLAVNTLLEPKDFVASSYFASVLASYDLAWLLGTAANAELLLLLADTSCGRRSLGRPGGLADSAGKRRIQVAAPSVLATRRQRAEPEMVLQRLLQLAGANSADQLWHDLSPHDLCVYKLLAELRASPGDAAVPGAALDMLDYHPAWLAASFIVNLNVNAVCRLLAEIVDPRWYRHGQRPGRLTKLYCHLGLTLPNMRAFLGECAPERHYHRALQALNVWHSPARCSANRPGGFLWRQLVDEDPARWLLRSTRRLVAFLALVWLYAVAPPFPEAEFDPLAFFREPIDARAYAEHAANFRRKVV